MNTPDQDINWDKVLAALTDGDTSHLTAAEQATYLEALQMKQLTKSEERFSTEEGWQKHIANRQQQGLKVRWRRQLAVAATLLVLLGAAGTWWALHQTKPAGKPGMLAQATLPPAAGVQIKMGNGQSVTLDSTGKVTRLANGTTVQLNQSNVIRFSVGSTVTVQLDTLVVPRGNKAHIVLGDGSHVWLNADSRLVYPNVFTGSARRVSVSGEAFFEVAPNAQQAFEVAAGPVNVTVLGTSFNINNYNTTIHTTLVTGKVSTGAAGNKLVLTPGQQAQYNTQTNQQQRISVDARIYTAWKDGDVYFEEAALGNILQQLGRSFDYNFTCKEPALMQLLLTLDMRQPATLQQVLDQITRITGTVQFRIEGRNIEVFRK
ncbi:FecR family protein [Chitinophaga jiangningensis]|uniref:FecR family protein n=1 Tax=Chitinophaga jiangningensis TaxID=1419482 RepID=A0A1M7J3D9_9BACT|nr:FecR domain-containing protein [Chitinophaga jiangningensis]SHM47569.1 FecR family protein [Chitinophaga jiangningensis]